MISNLLPSTRFTGRTAGLLLMTLFAAGCSSLLAPRPNRTRFYVLSSTADVGAASERGTAVDFAVGLGPLKLPDYLNRTQRAVRVGPNQLRFLRTSAGPKRSTRVLCACCRRI